MKPSLYQTNIRHVRRAPLANSFTYRSYSWFVDLDELPRLPGWLRPFAVFRAEDHLGSPDRSLRQTNPLLALVSRLLEIADGRVTATDVVDLVGSDPVRRRFRLGDFEPAPAPA